MEVTLNISNSLARKIKALAVLEGKGNEGFEDKIAAALEETVGKKIVALVAGTNTSPRIMVPYARTHEEGPEVTSEMTYTDDVATGLGDYDDDEDDNADIGQRVENAEGLIPTTGGLTEEDLENDMRIEDPNTEAISFDVPAGYIDQEKSAEDLFSSSLNIPPPAGIGCCPNCPAYPYSPRLAFISSRIGLESLTGSSNPFL